MTLNSREIKHILISGVLLYLSFPYFPTGILSLVAIIPIFILLQDKDTFSYGFKIGYWFGVVFTALVFYWIANNILITAIIVPFINGLFWGIFWGIVTRLKKFLKDKIYHILPFMWVLFEYSREFTDLRFNWLNLAHTFTYYTPFIQFVDITGYLGLSFLIILSNILIYYAFFFQKENKKRYLYILFIMWIIPLLYGTFKLRIINQEMEASPKIKAGYVQPNIDPWLKWEPQLQQMSVDTLFNVTQRVIEQGVDLIVWPETATPFFLRQKRSVIHRIQSLSSLHSFYLLTGTLDYKLDRHAARGYYTYNSAFLFGPDISGFRKYDKIYLVPGAETVPFYSLLRPLADKIDLGQGNFQPGKYPQVFSLTSQLLKFVDKFPGKSIRFGVGICYDSVFPALFREYIKQNSRFFVIITNDGWFGKTTGPFQHKQIAVLRAIENRRSIIRCANTGISCFILPNGKILKESGLEVVAEATEWIPLLKEKTFYAKYAPWFEILCLIILVGQLIWYIKDNKSKMFR